MLFHRVCELKEANWGLAEAPVSVPDMFATQETSIFIPVITFFIEYCCNWDKIVHVHIIYNHLVLNNYYTHTVIPQDAAKIPDENSLHQN